MAIKLAFTEWRIFSISSVARVISRSLTIPAEMTMSGKRTSASERLATSLAALSNLTISAVTSGIAAGGLALQKSTTFFSVSAASRYESGVYAFSMIAVAS